MTRKVTSCHVTSYLRVPSESSCLAASTHGHDLGGPGPLAAASGSGPGMGPPARVPAWVTAAWAGPAGLTAAPGSPTGRRAAAAGRARPGASEDSDDPWPAGPTPEALTLAGPSNDRAWSVHCARHRRPGVAGGGPSGPPAGPGPRTQGATQLAAESESRPRPPHPPRLAPGSRCRARAQFKIRPTYFWSSHGAGPTALRSRLDVAMSKRAHDELDEVNTMWHETTFAFLIHIFSANFTKSI